MFFSRCHRRGGWNNNSDCPQFKWALRAIILENRIVPSKNANLTTEEPMNNLLQQNASAAVRHTNENYAGLCRTAECAL